MKRLTLAIGIAVLISSVMFPDFHSQTVSAQDDSWWFVEFFNNTLLTGSPAASAYVGSPGFEWTMGAPMPGVTSDYFSARWTGSLWLEAGRYQISVQADDGVRVFFDGSLIINEFHLATGYPYSTVYSTAVAGTHSIIIEYFEETEAAYLIFDLQQLAPIPTVTVKSHTLHVFDIPDSSGMIVTDVYQDQTFPILGRTQDWLWWQIDASGMAGWVSTNFVTVVGGDSVPVIVPPTPTPPPTLPLSPLTVTALQDLPIRSGPDIGYVQLGTVPTNYTAQILGRNATVTWWYVSYNGLIGWVNAAATIIPPGTDVYAIPIAG